MSPDDALFVLNGLEPVDLDDLEFCVITTPSDHVWSDRLQRLVAHVSWWPFQCGEVLLVDRSSGREPFGEGRKPGKWSVGTEYVSTLAEALAIHQEVLAANNPPGGEPT